MEEPGSKPINELVRLAIIGDGTAFARLWDTHIDALKKFLKSWIKNIDDFYVDDICSRSFEKAFRQIRSFDPSKSQFSTWLRTIARNTALDTLERDKNIRAPFVSLNENLAAAEADAVGDDSDTPLESIIKTEDEETTLRYIEGLPELYRQVAQLRLVDGLQYKEIAEELGLELNTVRTRIRRAKTLIERMKKEEV